MDESQGMDVIRDREENDAWFGGRDVDPAEEHRFTGHTIADRQARLDAVRETVVREAEQDYGHSLHQGVTFTTANRPGVGEWIICRKCGGEITIEVREDLEVEVEGCNIEPCPSS